MQQMAGQPGGNGGAADLIKDSTTATFMAGVYRLRAFEGPCRECRGVRGPAPGARSLRGFSADGYGKAVHFREPDATRSTGGRVPAGRARCRN